jgi:hypothetical protein
MSLCLKNKCFTDFRMFTQGAYKSSPLGSVPGHMNPFHILTQQRSILILSSHLRLSNPRGLFLSGMPAKALYTFLMFPMRY